MQCTLCTLLSCLVQNPYLEFTNGIRSVTVYYVGEEANITSTSSVPDTMFTWEAVDFLTMEPLNLSHKATSSDVFDLSIISSNRGFVLDITCNATISGYNNIVPGSTRALVKMEGKYKHNK